MKLDFEILSPTVSSAYNSQGDPELAGASADISQMLANGIRAARDGDYNEARILLAQVSEADPENEDAWLWMASISQYPEELLAFLNNVLTLNPKNQRALQWAAATKAALAKSFIERGADASNQKQSNFAKQCFLQAIVYEPTNAAAWLRLAAVSTEAEEKRGCLEKVRLLDPENETALNFFESESPQKSETGEIQFKAHVAVENYEVYNASEFEVTTAVAEVSERLPEISRAYQTAEPADFAAAPFSADEEKLPSYYEAEPTAGDWREPAERPNNQSERALKNKLILIVDDSATVRRLIADRLEKSGHAVLCAVDGVDALEKISGARPDLVLLDISMPRMDGYQVCKLIRANAKTKDVPVVMISGKDGFFDKVRGRMAGTSGYITKPFGPDALLKIVETHTAGSESLD